MNHLPKKTDVEGNTVQSPATKQPWSTPTVTELSVSKTAAGGTPESEGGATRAGSS